MAANLQSSRLASSFGKRLASQIRSLDSVVIPSLSLRRSVHAWVYEKNLEEHARGTIVPDDVIGGQAEQYWSPHPQTGVFGPEKDHIAGSLGGLDVKASAETVLEQKAFFRPIEDLDKPIHTD